MGMCAKSLTNGMNVAAPRAKRHGNRYSKADKMKTSKTNDVSRRSSQNGAARFAVLPSVELQAALLRQGRILKPWNKSARQNGPRKG